MIVGVVIGLLRMFFLLFFNVHLIRMHFLNDVMVWHNGRVVWNVSFM
jgi:hypothetical protein